MKKITSILYKFFTGISNSLFGAGGGIIAVTYFKNKGLSQKKAQATSLFTMLVLTVISCGYYICNSYFSVKTAMPYFPFGILGAVTGAVLLKKIPDSFLKKAFALFIIYAGIKMLRR